MSLLDAYIAVLLGLRAGRLGQLLAPVERDVSAYDDLEPNL